MDESVAPSCVMLPKGERHAGESWPGGGVSVVIWGAICGICFLRLELFQNLLPDRGGDISAQWCINDVPRPVVVVFVFVMRHCFPAG